MHFCVDSVIGHDGQRSGTGRAIRGSRRAIAVADVVGATSKRKRKLVLGDDVSCCAIKTDDLGGGATVLDNKYSSIGTNREFGSQGSRRAEIPGLVARCPIHTD